jgi:hypothetical protein
MPPSDGTQSLDDLRRFDSPEMARRGWRFCGVAVSKEWGVDRGVRFLNFTKRDLIATIEYLGPNAPATYGCDFSISVSSGLVDRCR